MVHDRNVRAHVLIPFLAGLLFGRIFFGVTAFAMRLNPLFGGSAFRTDKYTGFMEIYGLNPLFGGSAFRTAPFIADAIRATS